ncbi:hypothetical protein BC938DRAFT_481617 [Jimgerdemannia flammicorona]|uniref:DOMON domain-containing protein n=1 Tax=Jimgerdemannia flammicorona TaxID=994334 RepID=A0A433QWY0_9FUNG|nr:hypothetical protein BC938DRAFT_481617 [Jimgerdemannia flammicorona]
MINLNHCLLLLALILSNSLAHAVTLQTYTPVSEWLPIDLASYTSGNANFMHDLYRLFWKLNLDAEVPSIDIALDVKTGGWLGFGLAEPNSGGMRGSDIVTLTVHPHNATHSLTSLTDRHALHHAFPSEDLCNQYTLHAGWRSPPGDDPRVVVAFSRPIDTNDNQDRPFKAGPVNIVMAYGEQKDVAYHGGNRHAFSVTFWEEEKEEEVWESMMVEGSQEDLSEAKSTKEERIFDYEYANTPTPILARETVYMCTGFEFNPPHPTNASLLATGHIVEIRPMIDPATMPYVHHYIVGACKGNTEKYRSMVGKPTECMTNGFDVMDVCPIMVYGWAVGSGPLVFPPVAGLPFGDPSDPFDTRHLLLQVHYDNQMPERTPAGLHDTSGLVIRYTFDKRQHDTALIHLGDGMVMGDPMPFGTEGKRRELEYTCPGECTALWPWDITAFAMWSSITSLATDPDVVTTTTDLDRTDFYEFEFQHVSHIHKVIKRGDRLNVHCVYDTSQNLFPHMRPNDTKVSFGLASEDEMCIDYSLGFDNGTACGPFSGNFPTRFPLISNPVLPNNTRYADHNSTRAIRFGTAPDTCSAPVMEVERVPARVLIVQKIRNRLQEWWRVVERLSRGWIA